MIDEPGKDYKFNKVSIGYGKKSDFLGLKNSNKVPAPNNYDNHVKDSISY